MSAVETPIRHTEDIPPAFYRDDNPPPPPSDDPHWREWWHDDRGEPTSGWIVYGLPIFLILCAIFHTVVLLFVLVHNGGS